MLMTKGSCNPMPAEPYNVMEEAIGGNEVFVSVIWSWDGVSVYPDCAGPLVSGRIWNTGTNTWYAHFVGRRGQPRTIAIPPGTDVTANAAFLSSHGLATFADLDDFGVTLVP